MESTAATAHLQGCGLPRILCLFQDVASVIPEPPHQDPANLLTSLLFVCANFANLSAKLVAFAHACFL